MERSLTFAGHIDDMPSFLAALDVFAFPSRMEGRSNALAEAIAAGLPIVASDIPGNDELIEHGKTGLLVPPENPEALANAIKKLIEDKDLAKKLASASAAFAEDKLDSEKIIAELEQYFLELLKG